MVDDTKLNPGTGGPVMFDEAFAAAQAEFPPVEKKGTAKAGSFSYDYADLADIQKAILPILNKHGFSVRQPTGYLDGVFGLFTKLTYSDGTFEESFYPLPDPSTTKAQDMGSNLTYARRYEFVSVSCVILVDEDDDGAKAQASEARPSKPESDPAAGAKAYVKKISDELQLASNAMEIESLRDREKTNMDSLGKRFDELWRELNAAFSARHDAVAEAPL